MPYTLYPDDYGAAASGSFPEDFRYRYPRRIALKPGSDRHDELLGKLMYRARAAFSAISNKHERWKEMDETLTAYIPLDEEEELLKNKDIRRPVSVVVPLSYATLETLLTYMVAAFLSDPIFRYEGIGSEDTIGATLLERMVNIQMQRAKAGIQLHTMFRDAFVYGIGAVTPIWTQKWGYKRVARRRGPLSNLTGEPMGEPTKERVETLLFEGNELYNIDPYTFLPDPNVPVQDVQRAEFVGWVRPESLNEILSRESRQPSNEQPTFFNGKYCKYISGNSIIGGDHSERDKDDVMAGNLYNDNRWVDVIYLYADIIPKEWGLGRHDYPEPWMFAIAGDKVIISASPLDLDHNMKPVAIAAPDYDGYSASPISKLETIRGLQTVVDFLHNSHITNVRKVLNDMLVVDPSLVNINDLMTPKPGKLIRLRKKAWGAGVKDAVNQLDVHDVTQNHIGDAFLINQLMDQSVGTPDAVKGIMRQSAERRSATEYRETKGSALSRLERIARIVSMQAMSDLGYMIASQTQQFTTSEHYVKLVGPYEDELRQIYGDTERVMVGPLDILVDYDVRVHDGTLPNSGDPAMWMTLFQLAEQSPQLMGKWDSMRMFQHIARLMGAKNVQDFVMKGGSIQTRTVSNEEAARGRQAGNLVPMGEMA